MASRRRVRLAMSSCISCSPTSRSRGEHHREPTLRFTQPRCVAHARAGSVKTARSTPSGSSSGSSAPGGRRSALRSSDEMNVALELVELERLQDILAALPARDDMPTIAPTRAQKFDDAFGRERLPDCHFASLSAATLADARRCRAMPVRFTFMPTSTPRLAMNHAGDHVDALVERHARDGVGLGALERRVPRWRWCRRTPCLADTSRHSMSRRRRCRC